MSCSPPPSCSAGWRWSGCWPGCRPAAIRSRWSPSATESPTTRPSTSKSAVSRRFVAMTETALADLLAADLSGLDLVAMMIDGVHFADHLCVVALGIGIDGTKHPLAAGRGVDGEHHLGPRSAGRAAGPRPGRHPPDPGGAGRRQGAIGGGQGGVRSAGDRPLPAPQATQRRKIICRRSCAVRWRSGCGPPTTPTPRSQAQAQLEALATELDKTHPGAAGSLREGLAETLTVLRLGVPPTLARTLRSTNAVESMISICRDHSRNVKRWRDGQMALRWCAAGMVEASKQFRRVNGHLHLPALRTALQRACRRRNRPNRLQQSRRERRLMLTGPPPKFHGTREYAQRARRGHADDDVI